MTARIRRTMEVELPVRRVFESPTLAGLAREVEQARASGLKAHASILQRRHRTAPEAAEDELLTQLDQLPVEEASSIVKAILGGRQTLGFRS
jgi:hypothetical protein